MRFSTTHPLFVLCCLLFTCSLFAQSSSINQQHLHIEPTPAWVDPVNIPLAESVPVDEISNGVFYQLLDNQIKVDKNGFRTTYSRYTETMVNQAGVENSAQINIDFDPSYQTLTLHSLNVIRDGKKISRLHNTSMSVLNRETDLDKQIYNGKLTLNILLDDVLPGDTLDYSYSRQGSNPVYQGIFSYQRSINWSVPVFHQQLRILWGKADPLYVESRNAAPVISRNALGEFTEYLIQRHNETPVKVSNQAPDWHAPYGQVYFNQAGNWSDVVAWARPLFQFGPVAPSVEKIAADIQQSFPTKEQRIVAALKYTQEHIRYVGLEMGENSHLPTPPEETLLLKYGDCKDKTSLLIALLQALEIHAYPALVNTNTTKLLNQLPPSANAFNHVIVWMEHQGQDIWLDPTLSHQHGDLSNLYQPDYAAALILKQGTTELSLMQPNPAQDNIEIIETFTIPEKHEMPVSLSVVSKYKGYDAISMHGRLEHKGRNKLAADYEDYYQRDFPSLSVVETLRFDEDPQSGELTSSELYQIDEFWQSGESNWEADFYPNDIRNALYKPDQIQRNAPLAFTYPNNITMVTHLNFEQEGWSFDEKEFSEDNDYFSYSSKVAFKDNRLTLTYQFNAKTDHIPQQDINQYLEARERVRDDAYYGIIKYKKQTETTSDTAASDEDSPMKNWMFVLFAIYGLGMGFILISWQWESRRRPHFPQAQYYPITMGKMLYLSAITFGLYCSYWMYRNWKFVKATQDPHMMPFWRGIFVPFWIFPFFQALKFDSESTYNTNKVCAVWLAVLCTLAFFAISIITNYSDDSKAQLLLLFYPLLLWPMIRYIKLRNAQAEEALHYNSRWRVRHIIGGLLIVPLLLVTLFSSVSLLPSDGVVTQSQLWQKDLKFFYRHQLVPVDEKVEYFYSDALLSIRDDGNGFTKSQVFSYWQDENNGLQKEVATFEDIANIEVKYGQKKLDNTIVTITREDNSDFMLFVAQAEEGDKLFVQELKKRWNATQKADSETETDVDQETNAESQ